MFGIGAPELMLIMVVALIIFGPQRLPEIAAQIGKAIRDFRRMSDDLTGEFQRSISLDKPPSAETPTLLTSQPVEAPSTLNGTSSVIAKSLRVEMVPSESDVPAAEAPAATPLLVLENAPEYSDATATNSGDMGIGLAPVDLAAIKADQLVGYDRTNTGNAIEPTASYEHLSPSVSESAPIIHDAAPFPDVESTREPVDHAVEVTSRGKIEAQSTTEVFRERRRIATYRKSRKLG